MSKPSRSIESSRTDARWRAQLNLPTGVVVNVFTEWLPPFWDKHRTTNRLEIIDQANEKRRELREKYGLQGISFLVYEETKTVQNIVETFTKETFASEHPACEDNNE